MYEFAVTAPDRAEPVVATPAHQHMAPRGWRDNLTLVQRLVPYTRRSVHAGETLYAGGAAFHQLFLLNSGQFKTQTLLSDGRAQVVGLHFRGDWLGFDGLAGDRHGCDAVALDTGEVWVIEYADLLAVSMRTPELIRQLHAAMSRQIGRGNDCLVSLGTLPADARVADFIRELARSLAERGLRTDQITLRMSRADIGNYLGMTLETVSRALGRMASSGVIRFDERGRRDVTIPCLVALDAFIRSALGHGSDMAHRRAA